MDCPLLGSETTTRYGYTHLARSWTMADFKDKVKEKIDDAAGAAKKATDKVTEKTKEAAQNVGQAVKKTGEKIKDAGK